MRKIKEKTAVDIDAEVRKVKQSIRYNQGLLFRVRAMERDISILKGMKEDSNYKNFYGLSPTILDKSIDWIKKRKTYFLKNHKVTNSLYGNV